MNKEAFNLYYILYFTEYVVIKIYLTEKEGEVVFF